MDISSAMNRLSIAEAATNEGTPNRRRCNRNNEENSNFPSKNLEAERRRREKLHYRLLTLRSHVPIITNMNKAAIIEDAITYIKELKINVETLTEQLLEMEGSELEEEMNPERDEINFAEEMKKCGMEAGVQLVKIGHSKYWMKILIEKRSGLFTEFVEALNFFGLEINDISLTTSCGTILVSSSVERTCDESLAVEETKEMLLDFLRGTKKCDFRPS